MTVRMMGQVGGTLAYLALIHGVAVFHATGSHMEAVFEMVVILALSLTVAEQMAIRFAQKW